MMDRERQLGATIDLDAWKALPLASLLFGEAQNRVVISTTDAPAVLAEAQRQGVPARVIGRVLAQSQSLSIRVGSRFVDAPLARLANAWHDAIPRIMSRSVAAAAAVITETLSQR
jgi:phosphoribosylformylglycinamidine (FGAM) synthase-like enzyme